MRCFVLALAGLMGCACGETADEAPTWPTAAAAPACSVVLSPGPVLVDATAAAAARWSAATGCDISLGEGGVPVGLALSIPRPDGSEAPGMTPADRSRIDINQRAGEPQRWRTVAHELGHVLGVDEHVGAGIMGDVGRLDVIDVAALASVCAHVPCSVMAPEAP
jgi:hypothetical protein